MQGHVAVARQPVLLTPETLPGHVDLGVDVAVGQHHHGEGSLAARLIHDARDGEVTTLIGDGVPRVGGIRAEVLADLQVAAVISLSHRRRDGGVDGRCLGRRAQRGNRDRQCGQCDQDVAGDVLEAHFSRVRHIGSISVSE